MTEKQISQESIFADEMYSEIRAEWAAAHFDIGLTISIIILDEDKREKKTIFYIFHSSDLDL